MSNNRLGRDSNGKASSKPVIKKRAKFTPATLFTALIFMSIAFGFGFGGMTVYADITQPVAIADAPTQAFVVH